MLQNKGQNWNDIRRLCQKQGADLVSIETIKERHFLIDLIQNQKILKQWVVGLEKIAGNWTWVSGKPLTINKWKENQPSNVGGVALVFEAFFNGSRRGLLQVIRRDRPHSSICEISKGKTTTHSSKLRACLKPLDEKK